MLTAIVLVPAAPAVGVADCTQIPEYTDGTVCIVREASVTVTAGQTVVINANVKVNDGGTVSVPPSSQNQPRYLMNVRVKCFNSSGTEVWTSDAARNLWDGMGTGGAYPRGVFVAPTSGTFLCQLDAVQRNLYTATSPDREFAVYSSSLTITAPFAQGFSSPGPLAGSTFPLGADDLTAADPQNPIMQHQVTIGAASSYTLTAHVYLSSCSFNSDITGGYCSALSSYGDKTFSGTMRLYARQRNTANTAYCGPSFIADTPFEVLKAMHHFTATSTGSFVQTTATCTGPLVIKVELLNLQGQGYLGHGDSGASLSHVGVAWN